MKIMLMFLFFSLLSFIITTVCVLGGYSPLQFVLANMAVGAILGLITGLINE